MPTIQLEQARPGIRGPLAPGGQALPAVKDGVSEALKDFAGRGLKALGGADFHTRVERIARMEEDNQVLEAQLAFDRWNAQALYGTKDNQAATASADFDKERDAQMRVMKLNGLMNARGVAAGDGGRMYAEASETFLNDIVGGLGQSARLRVLPALRARRESELIRLNRHGLNERESAIRFRQAQLVEGISAQQAENAARDISLAEGKFEAEAAEARAAYQSTLANLPPKEGWTPAQEGQTYEQFAKDYSATASANLAGQLGAIEAKRLGAWAKAGGAYAAARTEAEAITRASILSELGLSAEEAASAEWAPVVEGRLAAERQKAGARFLKSMLETGHVDFVGAAVEDPAALAANYGITDSRIVEALKIDVAGRVAGQKQTAASNKELAKYQAEQLQAWDLKTGTWSHPIEDALRLEQGYLSAGDFEAATLIRRVINNRVEAMKNDAELANDELDVLEPDYWENFLNGLELSDVPYVNLRVLGKGGKPEDKKISRQSLMRWIVWNRLGLGSEDAKRARWNQISQGPDRGLLAAANALNGGGAGIGLYWQRTKDGTFEGETRGDIYELTRTVADAGNFPIRMDGRGGLGLDADTEHIHGAVYVRNGNEIYQRLNEADIQTSVDLLVRYMRSYAEANPEATDDMLRQEAEGKAMQLFGYELSLGTTQEARATTFLSQIFNAEREVASQMNLLTNATMRNKTGDRGVFLGTWDDSGRVVSEPLARAPRQAPAKNLNGTEDKKQEDKDDGAGQSGEK